MGRGLRAALEAGGVLVLTAVVAFVVAHRHPSYLIAPTAVTLLGSPDPEAQLVTFVVRGAGCPAPPEARDRGGHRIKSPAERVKQPTLQYTAHTIDVHFRVEDPGKWRCHGYEPGVPYTVRLPFPLSGRQLRDASFSPPRPFTRELTR